MVTATKKKVLKLDVACGKNKTPGFTGIDISGDADIKHDLLSTPWPIASSSVKELVCNHFVEHIPHLIPGETRDGWFVFFDEVYRVLRKGAVAQFVHPYVKSDRAFWDPTHQRFISEATWLYLNKDWRVANGLDHYETVSDFDIVTISGTGIAEDIINRNEEFQAMARQHYWNVISDLQVIITKR